jgi:RNA polymerase sigma-70 factor, ECF subfamily
MASTGIPVRQATADQVEKLYREFEVPIYRFCLAQLGDRNDAEDALIEIFTAVLKDYERTNPDDDGVKKWLWHIVRNKVIDYHRASVRKAKLSTRLLSDTGNWVWREVNGWDPEEDAMHRAQVRRIRSAIAALQEPGRSILAMRVFGELSNPEIGEIMNMTSNAVGVALHRAKKQLEKKGALQRGTNQLQESEART